MLVFGGSLGARSINLAARRGVRGRAPFRVLHVCGRRDYAELAGARAARRATTCASTSTLEEFADALAAADLVVARAGGSVFEIAAHGLPAILVPYPHAAADHQSANARWMADAGAAVVIADGELTRRAPRRRGRGAARRPPRAWRRWRAASRALARPQAAARGRRRAAGGGRAR